MIRNVTRLENIMTAKTSTDVGTSLLISDYQNVVISVASSGSASFTIKFQGSIADTCPDFSAAKSVTNPWEYIQVKDYQNDASINGSTGVTFSGDDCRLFEFNTNGLSWINAVITSYSSGAVTVTCKAYHL